MRARIPISRFRRPDGTFPPLAGADPVTDIRPSTDAERRARAGNLSMIRADIAGVEIRTVDGSEDLIFTGHAAVFDQLSEELGGAGWSFREKIQRGAFRKALDESQDVIYVFDHEGLPLARTSANTLQLREDPIGLYVDARAVPTTVASDLAMAMRAGNVRQMSFAFTVAEDAWEIQHHEDGTVEEIRTIITIDRLYDVSAVSTPAYPQTDAQVRSRELGSVARRFGLHLPDESDHPVQLARSGAGRADESGREEREARLHEQQAGAKRLLTLAHNYAPLA